MLPHALQTEICPYRAGMGFESHIVDAFSDRAAGTFPLMREPTHTPGFVQHHSSDQEKSDLLAKVVAIDHTSRNLSRPSPTLRTRST